MDVKYTALVYSKRHYAQTVQPRDSTRQTPISKASVQSFCKDVVATCFDVEDSYRFLSEMTES